MIRSINSNKHVYHEYLMNQQQSRAWKPRTAFLMKYHLSYLLTNDFLRRNRNKDNGFEK